MWTAIATLGAALISGVFGLLGMKKSGTPEDGLARVQAGSDAVKKVDHSDNAQAHDPANRDGA